MRDVNLTVRTFRMDTDKQAALKPLEEAAEIYGVWQMCAHANTLVVVGRHDNSKERRFQHFADEIADCIQACVNLADRYGINLEDAMERCERRNRERGRYE